MGTPIRTILVIDDEWPIAQMLCEVLEDAGYHVRSAANGRDGLRQLDAELPALIICDLMMPVLDGRGFCRALRADLRLAAIPLILTSAATTVLSQGDCAHTAFLPKLINLDTLLTLIQNLINND